MLRILAMHEAKSINTHHFNNLWAIDWKIEVKWKVPLVVPWN